MSSYKARMQRSKLYLLILTFITLLHLIFPVLLPVLLIVLAFPVGYCLYITKKNAPSILSMGSAGLFIVIFAFNFRFLRDTLPPPQIHTNKIVGYSQYFGYPFFLDTATILLLLLLPVILFFLLGILKKKHNSTS